MVEALLKWVILNLDWMKHFRTNYGEQSSIGKRMNVMT